MSSNPEIIAGDEMYTVRRRPPPPGSTLAERRRYLASQASPELPFDDWLRQYLAFIDDWLSQLGRPPASGALWIAGERWRDIRAVSVAQRVRGRIVLGSEYLLETEKKLTLSWWLAKLAHEARLTLDAQNANHKMHRALVLGELRERFKSHRLFRDKVALGAKTAPIRAVQRDSGSLRRKDDTNRLIKHMDKLLIKNPARKLNWAAMTLARRTRRSGTECEIKKYADSLRKRYEYHKNKLGEE